MIFTLGKLNLLQLDSLSKTVPWLLNEVSSEVAFNLYKSTTWHYMTYCCHVWVCATRCYLDMFDSLQKQICRTVCPSLAASLKPLPYWQNAASLSLFYRYYFGRYSSDLIKLVLLLHSCDRYTCYCNRLHHFSVTVPTC